MLTLVLENELNFIYMIENKGKCESLFLSVWMVMFEVILKKKKIMFLIGINSVRVLNILALEFLFETDRFFIVHIFTI